MNTPFRPQFSPTQSPTAFNPFSASNTLPPELHLFALSESERTAFFNYFNQLDPFSSGKLENSAVLEFLQTCGLQNSVLSQIFSYFDSADNGLSEAQFYAILRLVAHAQTGQEISRDLVYIQAAPPRFGSDPVNAYLNSKRRSQLPRSSYSSTSYSSMQHTNFVSDNNGPGNKDRFGVNLSNPPDLKTSNNWWDVATDDLYLLTSAPHQSRLSRSATISTSNPFNTSSSNVSQKSPTELQNIATSNREFVPSTDIKRFSTGLIKQKGRLSLPFGQSISQNTPQPYTLPQSHSSSLSQPISSQNIEIPSTLSSPTPRIQRPKFSNRASLELGDFQRMMMMSPSTSPVSTFGNPFTALRQLEELNTPSSFSQSINSPSLSGPNSPQELAGASSLTRSYFSPEISGNTAHKSRYTELRQSDYSVLVNKRPNRKGQHAPLVPPQITKPISLKYSLRSKANHTDMDKTSMLSNTNLFTSSSSLNTPNLRGKSLDQELEDLQRDLANLRAVSLGLRNES